MKEWITTGCDGKKISTVRWDNTHVHLMILGPSGGLHGGILMTNDQIKLLATELMMTIKKDK